MLSGIAVAAKTLKPSIRIIAVEPEGKMLDPNPITLTLTLTLSP